MEKTQDWEKNYWNQHNCLQQQVGLVSLALVLLFAVQCVSETQFALNQICELKCTPEAVLSLGEL